jgi:hypothetical protein
MILIPIGLFFYKKPVCREDYTTSRGLVSLLFCHLLASYTVFALWLSCLSSSVNESLWGTQDGQLSAYQESEAACQAATRSMHGMIGPSLANRDEAVA